MFSPTFSAPLSPAEPPAVDVPSKAYKVLKKAVIKKEASLDSEKCGALPAGTVVEALEMHGSNRVRTKLGWLSIVASSGNTLLEAVPAAAPNKSSSLAEAKWFWEVKEWERGASGTASSKAFDPGSAKKLEGAYRNYRAGGGGTIKLVLGTAEYKIDLRNMVQLNAKTAFSRKLSRQGVDIPQTRPPPPAATHKETSARTPGPPKEKRQALDSALAAQRVKQQTMPGPLGAARATAPATAGARSPMQGGQSPQEQSPALQRTAAATKTNPDWPGPGPQPAATLYLPKGKSTMLWSCRLLHRGPTLGFFVETQFGRSLPMAKCLARDKTPPEGTRVATKEEGLALMKTKAQEKMGRGYQRNLPPECGSLPHFFEMGSMHQCAAPSCCKALQAPERCEQLQCHHPGCETYVSASAEARRLAAEEAARIERERKRAETTEKALKCGTAFAARRDGGEHDQKAIRMFHFGLTKGDPHHPGLKQGLAAAQARVKVVKIEAAMISAARESCDDVGKVRETLEAATPLVKAAMKGPVQHLPFSWLVGASAEEKRQTAHDRLKKALKQLTRNHKNLHAKVKKEQEACRIAAIKEAQAASAKNNPFVARCYKCNWPGKPGETCPNCSGGGDVVTLPDALPVVRRKSGFDSRSEGEFVCEYAKSSRAKCHGTGEMIEKGELRIGVTERSETAGGRVVPRWFHYEAFFDSAKADGLGDVSSISGYELLRAHDQAFLKNSLEEMQKAAAAGFGKKRKAEVDLTYDEEDDDEDGWDNDDDDSSDRTGKGGVTDLISSDDEASASSSSRNKCNWELKIGDVVELVPGVTDYEGGAAPSPLLSSSSEHCRLLPAAAATALHSS